MATVQPEKAGCQLCVLRHQQQSTVGYCGVQCGHLVCDKRGHVPLSCSPPLWPRPVSFEIVTCPFLFVTSVPALCPGCCQTKNRGNVRAAPGGHSTAQGVQPLPFPPAHQPPAPDGLPPSRTLSPAQLYPVPSCPQLPPAGAQGQDGSLNLPASGAARRAGVGGPLLLRVTSALAHPPQSQS